MAKPIEALKAAALHALARRGPGKLGSWRGVRMLKYPTDPMLYAEMIFEHKPDVIIETGTRYGGASLFLADICRLAGHGRVISIDIDDSFADGVSHSRLFRLVGNSVSEEILATVQQNLDDYGAKKVMVILDSDHSEAHILAELNAYSQFVNVGGYMIAEDLFADNGDRSVQRFLKLQNGAFERDKKIEKYGIHAARDGFLKRIA